MSSPLAALPIDEVLPEVVSCFEKHPSLVLHAPPGAGKTTRVPPALLATLPAGARLVLLQPRRMAARSAARRLAFEQGETLGEAIGYRVRFDDRSGPATRLLVATEGVLVRHLQRDPYLEPWQVLVFDEFHERRLDTELVLGMARRLQQTVRPDLKIVVMSATLDPEPIARYLDDAPIVRSSGRQFPVQVHYARRVDRRDLPSRIVDQVTHVIQRHEGDLLVFLPGVGEIRQCQRGLEMLQRQHDLLVLPLYGDLPPEEQDRVLQPSGQRKVVLSTNVAETSLTIEGITTVIDSGLARVLHFDPHLGLDRLDLAPISQASAEQRAGRAGRLGPGHAYRLWEEPQQRHRAPFDLPESARVDLSGAVLQLKSWGEHRLDEFPWFEAPDPQRLQTALHLLERLGAVHDDRLTEVGEQMVGLPLQPRLARLLIEGERRGVLERCALLAALLSERSPFQRAPSGSTSRPRGAQRPIAQRSVRSDSDVLDELQDFEAYLRGETVTSRFGHLQRGAARQVVRVAEQLLAAMRRQSESEFPAARHSDEAVLRALLAAYPDRLARRRSPGSPKGTLVGGRGVKLDARSSVLDAELFLCVDVDAGGSDVLVRKASGVRRDWLDPEGLSQRDELFFHPTQKAVVARRRTYWDDLLLDETPTAVEDPEAAARVLAAEARQQWASIDPCKNEAFRNLVARIKFLRHWVPEVELPDVSQAALQDRLVTVCWNVSSLAEVRQADWVSLLLNELTYEQRQFLDREAPARWTLPSGVTAAMTYADEGPPVLAAKIQDWFGTTETPRVARNRVAVLLHLLAPNQRPHQITDDLASFWANTYAVVRKELRGRYPKHPWPEDPLSATPGRRRS